MKPSLKTLADLSSAVIPNKPQNDVKTLVLRHNSKSTPNISSSRSRNVTPRKTRSTHDVTPTPQPSLLPDIHHDVSTKNDVSADVTAKKTPADAMGLPMEGEKPHDLLQRLYEMWPAQLSQSYQPSAKANPEATADYNFRFLRKLHPPVVSRAEPILSLHRVKAAGVVVETVFHLGKKTHYNLNLKRAQAAFSLHK